MGKKSTGVAFSARCILLLCLSFLAHGPCSAKLVNAWWGVSFIRPSLLRFGSRISFGLLVFARYDDR